MLFERVAAVQFLVVLCYIVCTHQQKQDPAFWETFNKTRAECAKQEGLDEVYVMKVWELNRFPDDPKLKCYFKCLNVKFGVVNEKGDVVDDKLRDVSAHFHDDATDREIVVECGGIEGADLCETSFKLMTCIKNATLD